MKWWSEKWWTPLSFSSLWRLRIDADQPCADLFYYALRERGLHLYAQFNCFLSLAHSEQDIEQIAASIDAVTSELLEAGVFTRRGDARRVADADVPAGGDAAPAARDLPAEIAPTDAQMEKWIACQFAQVGDRITEQPVASVTWASPDRAPRR